MDKNGFPNNAANFVKNLNLVKFLKFGQYSEIESKFRNMVAIQKFGERKILKFGQHSENWLKL